MGATPRKNAMRSVVVVIGALAFGYLSLQLGFKPYLEKAQLEQQRLDALLQAQSAASQDQDSFDDSFHTAGTTLSDGQYVPDSVIYISHEIAVNPGGTYDVRPNTSATQESSEIDTLCWRGHVPSSRDSAARESSCSRLS